MSNFDPVTLAVVLALLALVPTVAVVSTSFLKISIVMSLVRNALGVQQAPPNIALYGMALILSAYVMAPVGIQAYDAMVAAQQSPSSSSQTGAGRSRGAGAMSGASGGNGDAYSSRDSSGGGDSNRYGGNFGAMRGQAVTLQGQPIRVDALLQGLSAGIQPLKAFMMRNSRAENRHFFIETAKRMWGDAIAAKVAPDNLIILVPAFVMSELNASFQMGFLLYLPFILIDLIVSNVLLAMGMMMVSPVTISLPLKLFLFVMVDGWSRLIQGLVLSYV